MCITFFVFALQVASLFLAEVWDFWLLLVTRDSRYCWSAS